MRSQERLCLLLSPYYQNDAIQEYFNSFLSYIAKLRLKGRIKIRRISLTDIVSSGRCRASFLVTGFLALIGIRLLTQAFGFSLGYLYVTLISLAGFWFQLKGALIAATAASLIFIAEVSIFTHWPMRDVVVQSMLFRFMFYYMGGISLAFISASEEKTKELKTLAYYDELTGCVNFRWLMSLIENEIERCRRYHKKMALIMIDIDHFKSINDTYGHTLGNEVLRLFAGILRSNVRSIDMVGRYGGEEFLIILPEADTHQALAVLDRIKKKVSEADIFSLSFRNEPGPQLHFSAGLAFFPQNGRDLDELISVVDNALYRAKRAGRNRVMVDNRRWLRAKPLAGLKAEIIKSATGEKIPVSEISNISRNGMLLLFPREVPEEEFVCSISCGPAKAVEGLKCKVIHEEKSEDGLYHIGVYFVDISKDTERTITRFMKH